MPGKGRGRGRGRGRGANNNNNIEPAKPGKTTVSDPGITTEQKKPVEERSVAESEARPRQEQVIKAPSQVAKRSGELHISQFYTKQGINISNEN